jgi:hypothetical protein
VQPRIRIHRAPICERRLSTRLHLVSKGTHIILASIHGFEHMFFHLGAGISAKEHFKALSAAFRRGQGLVVNTLIANERSLASRAGSDYSEVVQAAALGHHGYILETLLDRSEGFCVQSRL